MAKLTKTADVIARLHSMVSKEAEAQKQITGKPCEDTKPAKISPETEHTDQNAVGADKLKPQEHGQKGSTDKAEPIAHAKSGEVQELATRLLSSIEKASNAQASITGKPGADTKPESMPAETEKTDQNAVGADKLKPQEHSQKPATNKSEPIAHAKKSEEVDVEVLAAKVASYQLGCQFAAALMKQAAEPKIPVSDLYKEAGRRDFDTLVAQAEEHLMKEKKGQKAAVAKSPVVESTPDEAVKQAEAAGAAYFDELVKQAYVEQAVQTIETQNTKIAELEGMLAAKQAAEQDEASKAKAVQDQADLASKVASIVIAKLKEDVAAPAK